MNPSLLSSQILSNFFIFFFFFIFTPSVLSYSTETISYSDHCNSFVQEADRTNQVFKRYRFFEPATSHYTGGQRILGPNPSDQRSIYFSTQTLYETNAIETYKFQARMRFISSYIYYEPSNFSYSRSNYSRTGWRYRHNPLVFYLDGFWSLSTSKLCMVGSAHWFSKEGESLQLHAVLKLKVSRDITLNTSLVSGILKSLASPNDSTYFEPISMLGFPRVARLKYNYSSVSNEECDGGNTNTEKDAITKMRSVELCSIYTNQFKTYQLKYGSNCSSSQNCGLFGRDSEHLPSFVSLYAIQCSWEEKKLLVLVEFQDRRYTPYDQSFNPNITLIGEGTWNGKKDELCIVACRILNQSDPLGSAHVGDCSIRLTLWYPAIRSIKNTHTTEGQIWTTKKADEIGYFETIEFQSFDHSLESYGLKYEFTQMEKVKRLCPMKKHDRTEKVIYASRYYRDMVFDMSVKHESMASFGSAVPVFLGDRFYNSYHTMVSNFSGREKAMTFTSTTGNNQPLNVSYEISIRLNNSSISRTGISSLNLSATANGRVEISAEGFYDEETGQICMVGCRKLESFGKNTSLDCEIRVRFQLPNGNWSFIEGSIESLREKQDALYFELLDVTSLTYTRTEAIKSIWEMDLETIMVLVSGTLSCFFILLQLIHIKKRPETVPFGSVLMMLILSGGYMVPLVLNFEAIFSNSRSQQNIQLGNNGGWLEVNEVIMRIVTMVAFILQFRLLQLTWAAKLSNEDRNGKSHWNHEIRTLVVCLPMYTIGGLATMLVNWMNDWYTIRSQRSIWGDLRSYAGLTLDGFLLPQLILNVFQHSKVNALSQSFYVGTTFVRLLPHVYDLFRSPEYISHRFDNFYIYANPRADFYSPSWDIIIVCGGIVFAFTIFLQQCFGGRFMLPKRFRESGEYEMVPVAINE